MRADQLPEDVSFEQLHQIYRDTVRESLQRMEGALQAQAPAGSELGLALIHRLSHNLKGSSLQFGIAPIAAVAGAVEALASALLRSQAAPDEQELSSLAAALDFLSRQVDLLDQGLPLEDAGPFLARFHGRSR